MMEKEDREQLVLKGIHLKILVLAGIVTPCLTASGAYWGLKLQIEQKDFQISERVSRVELENTKNFADKQSLQSLTQEVKQIHDDVTEIKAILKSRHR